MRKVYVDNIRWMTVVLVVIYHVLYMFNGVGVAGGIGSITKVRFQDGLLYIIYPWFMLLLFVISGMSARYYLEKHTHKEFRQSRTVKLLVPSTVGILLVGWITGYFNILIGGGMEGVSTLPVVIRYVIMVLSGTGPLWYIQVLWVLSLLLLGIRNLEKDRLYGVCGKVNLPVLLVFVFIIWGSSMICNIPVVEVYRFGIYGVGFLAGYFIFSHDEVMEKLEKAWYILLPVAVLLGVVFVAVFWLKPYASHEVLDTFLCNAYAWFAVLAILSTMKRWGNFQNAFTELIKKQSWGLYIFHYLPLSVSAWFLSKYADMLPALLIYILVLSASFIGAVMLYRIISHIPGLRWCICGIKKPERK